MISHEYLQKNQLLARAVLFGTLLVIALLAGSVTDAGAATFSKIGSFPGKPDQLHADQGFLYSLEGDGSDVTIRRMDANTGAVQIVFTATKGSPIQGGVIDGQFGRSLSVRNGLIVFVMTSGWIENVVPGAKDSVDKVIAVRASDGAARLITTARSRYENESTEDTSPCGLAVDSASVTTRQRLNVKFLNVGGPTATLRTCPPTLIEESGQFVRSFGEDGSGGEIVHQSLSQFWSMPDGRRFIGLRRRVLSFENKTNDKVKRIPVKRNVVTDVIDTSNRLGFMLRTIRVEKRRNIDTTTYYPKFGSLKNGVRLRGFATFCGPVIAQRLYLAENIRLLNKRGRTIKRLPFKAGTDFGGIHCTPSQIFATRITSSSTEVFVANLP